MRKLLGTLMLGIIVFGLVGLFRGWLSVSTDGKDEKAKIEVTIDKQQLRNDAARIKDGVQNLSGRTGSDEQFPIPSGGHELPFTSDPNPPILPPQH